MIKTVLVTSPNGGYGARACTNPWFAPNIKKIPQPEIIIDDLIFFS
jgi:hypothetical protein